jgi:hypothetical protein
VGVSDVGRNLIIFSVQTKIEKMPKIILKQTHLIRSIPVSDNGSTKGNI